MLAQPRLTSQAIRHYQLVLMSLKLLLHPLAGGVLRPLSANTAHVSACCLCRSIVQRGPLPHKLGCCSRDDVP